uniref:Uncharacterized protein n=1 Tax=Octopus bimaculoides TaxID=37653 RepID=A0A0L8HKZ1_OCTBM
MHHRVGHTACNMMTFSPQRFVHCAFLFGDFYKNGMLMNKVQCISYKSKLRTNFLEDKVWRVVSTVYKICTWEQIFQSHLYI